MQDPLAEQLPVAAKAAVASPPYLRYARIARVVLLVVGALWLFLIGLSTMKTGAKALAPTLGDSTFTDSLASALGLGWLSAMMVMSGSPIAASALALLDAGTLTRDETFMALTGSRLGASFVVFLVSVLYATRGKIPRHMRRASLSVGIFALVMTAFAYLPGAVLGLTLLRSGALGPAGHLPLSEMENVVAAMTDPAVDRLKEITVGGGLFFIGLAILLLGLRLLDKVLPTPDEGRFASSGWRDNRWIMFAIGSVVAFFTMSVSVALTVLVPAVAKGYLRRRHAIAYIAGANVTTLADTLVTAVLLGNPDAVRVVLAELIGVGIVTLIMIGFLYGPTERRLLQITDYLLVSKQRLGAFALGMFIVPLSLALLVPLPF